MSEDELLDRAQWTDLPEYGPDGDMRPWISQENRAAEWDDWRAE